MTAGRKPVPAHLKLVKNNPGKRPLPEKKVKLSSTIRMPNGMSAEEKRIWRWTIKHAPLGMVKDLDVQALRHYCEQCAEYDYARKKLKSGRLVKTSSGTARPSPWYKIANDAFDKIHKLNAEFGFTPSSRTKLGLMDAGPLTGDGEEDEYF